MRRGIDICVYMPGCCVDLLDLAVFWLDAGLLLVWCGFIVVWFGVWYRVYTALHTRLLFVMVAGCCWACSVFTF